MKKTGAEKTDETSSRIVDLFFSRDEKAIEIVAEKYGKLFRRIALNITSDASLTEEAVNDTYLALWNRIPPDRPGSIPAYGAALARNISISKVRTARAEKRPQAVCELDEALPDEDWADRLEDGRLTRLLEIFLDRIDKRSRAVFVIRYFEEEPLERIADRTGMSVTAVKSNLHRTRKKLRAFLESEGYGI